MIQQLPSAAEMQERLAAWAAQYLVPGAALAWMHGDEVQSAAAGTINVETGVPVTPDTLFQIGSITKLYTTTLVMQLVDEGRIELDAPATAYLPDLRFGDGAAPITVRHLLTHTSGVDGDFFDDFGRGDDAVARYVAASAKLEQLFAPGAMWSYCNAGFVVLGRIVETLTGQTWDEALKLRLLAPLGATRTVTLPEDALLHTTAAGHRVSPSLEIRLAKPWGMARAAGPAGATPCSTVADLLTFAKMHLDGGVSGDGARILAASSVAAMQEPQAALPPAPGEFASRWGLGWMLFDWGGRRVIGHDGGTIGQAASLRILPDERFAVAIVTNSISGGLLASSVMRWLFEETMGVEVPPRPEPPESPPAFDLAPYAGVYERLNVRTTVALHEGALTAQTVESGALAASGDQFPAAPLVPVDRSLFLQWTPLMVYQPVVFSEFDAEGRPRYMFANRVARRAAGT